MRNINNRSTADEAWTAHQEEKAFALVAPRLQSLTESHTERICPGYLSQGCVNANAISQGDEPEPGDDICTACIREEEKFYQREMRVRDDRDSEVAGSQYRTQYLERMEELREAQRTQAILAQAIR